MMPTSQGFAEVREVFFKEVTDMNMNVVNEGGMEKLGEVRPLEDVAQIPIAGLAGWAERPRGMASVATAGCMGGGQHAV